MDCPILEFSKVNKAYGANQVLCDLDFVVKRGEICGLVGANGAGKTTMMKLAVNLISNNSGTVNLSLQKKGNIGILIDTPMLDRSLTVRQNLEAYSRLCSYSRESVDDAINLMGIEGFSNKKVKHLSSGMKQKTALARALMGLPEFVILDEPVNGLDPQGVRDVREKIVYMNKEYGTTFLISSHLIDELVKVVTGCAILKNGQIRVVDADAEKIEDVFFASSEVHL